MAICATTAGLAVGRLATAAVAGSADASAGRNSWSRWHTLQCHNSSCQVCSSGHLCLGVSTRQEPLIAHAVHMKKSQACARGGVAMRRPCCMVRVVGVVRSPRSNRRSRARCPC